MDAIITFLLYAAILLVISMIGAYIPYIRKLSDKQVHLLVALSAGIFIGILFFLLLPEALSESIEANYDTKMIMLVIMSGFLLILFIDVLIKHFHMASCPCECHEDEHRHNMGSISAFIGLSVHACVDGLALAASISVGSEIGLMALAGMGIHKFVVLFSLSSTFLLTDQPKKKSLTYLLAFALITPIAGLVSFAVLNGMSVDGMVGLPLAFSAGTFMYVALCNMLPEAFHRKNQEMRAFIFIMLGIAVAAIVFLTFGHVH